MSIWHWSYYRLAKEPKLSSAKFGCNCPFGVKDVKLIVPDIDLSKPVLLSSDK